MKIICCEKHRLKLKSVLREYLDLDIVLVEKGYDYEGLCYYFSMEHLDELSRYLDQSCEYILCYQGNQMFKIAPQQIIYIEGYSKEAYVYTKTKQYLTHQKLYELEGKLSFYHFARANKSMIVNIHEIDSFIPDVQRRYIIVLKNKQRILLTRNYVKSFMEKLRRKAL